MTYATVTSYEVDRFERGLPSRRAIGPTIAAATALSLGVLIGTVLPYRLSAPVPAQVSPGPTLRSVALPAPPPRAPAPKRAMLTRPAHRATAAARPVPTRPDPALLEAAFSLGPAPLPFDRSHPLAATFVSAPTAVAVAPVPPVRIAEAEVPAPAAASPPRSIPLPETAASPLVASEPVPLPPVLSLGGDVPLPEPRPAMAGPVPPAIGAPSRAVPLRPTRHRLALRTAPAASTAAPPDNRGFFDSFFGMFKPAGPALGYAAPEDRLFPRPQGIPSGATRAFDRWTAVYDISAHTVYLPSGATLEAHSGLGNRLDDPRYVSERNRGPTPPQVYDLEPREQLFHGVQALRLNPLGGGGVYGRTGLLAHTFMLGPNGDSNGCVSFRDYQAFLRAYRTGEIRRLAVVTRL